MKEVYEIMTMSGNGTFIGTGYRFEFRTDAYQSLTDLFEQGKKGTFRIDTIYTTDYEDK